MPLRQFRLFPILTLLAVTYSISLVRSSPTGQGTALDKNKRDSNPLNIDWRPAPSPEDGPAFSAGALRDTKYLPAQIAGLVAAYGLSLVLVAVVLLSLAKKRREHLQSGIKEIDYQTPKPLYGDESPVEGFSIFPLSNPAREVLPNSLYPSPVQTQLNEQPLAHHANAQDIPAQPRLTCSAPETEPSAADKSVTSAREDMAQSQLDEMYRHVLEQDDAIQRGIVLDEPVNAGPCGGISRTDKVVTSPRKDRIKPANLKLKAAAFGDKTFGDKAQSKTSAFFAALRSPRKKQIKGVNISSPIMTPQSGTFPRHESREMSAIPPRNYAPLPPPPIPSEQIPLGARVRKARGPPLELTPESIQSIDQQINTQLHALKVSQANSEVDPVSTTSRHSQTPLVELPSSHKANANIGSTLPVSPKPGDTFPRANAPSAVRAGGNLPLRAYEPAMSSPMDTCQMTKQTVFERRGPLSPTTGRAPMTAGAVPYSPYQPFTPVIPITPSLVTKEDRKRMRRMVPKTPTMEMVKDSDEMW
ncbi:hypothetical protein E4U21_005191 [Claviceps maximensis]|nr:hypothetical protein E4U21_005191 [Claviceps maximensis]